MVLGRWRPVDDGGDSRSGGVEGEHGFLSTLVIPGPIDFPNQRLHFVAASTAQSVGRTGSTRKKCGRRAKRRFFSREPCVLRRGQHADRAEDEPCSTGARLHPPGRTMAVNGRMAGTHRKNACRRRATCFTPSYEDPHPLVWRGSPHRMQCLTHSDDMRHTPACNASTARRRGSPPRKNEGPQSYAEDHAPGRRNALGDRRASSTGKNVIVHTDQRHHPCGRT